MNLLSTPPCGLVLDQFAAIGVERDADYIELIGERLGWSAA